MNEIVRIEASPYIDTKGSKDAQELYDIPFDYGRIANKFGEKPLKMFGFWESDDAFHHRLNQWTHEQENLLFDGWTCKDMHVYKQLTNKEKTVIITIETNEYEVNYSGRRFLFPVLPDTIDDFINDFKRIGIKLFWMPRIADIYGIDNVTSNKKIIDYYALIKDINGSSS